jgi:chemotaxis protein histidine kinase CheA
MALTGQLSDMSLAELIEFFCNQRKTGRLKIDYPRGHSVFFIRDGELVDAKVGALSGVEAVYFSLTLPNAAFDFSPDVHSKSRTINEPWTQVVLEGLRRLDEGLSPKESDAFGGWSPSETELAQMLDQVEQLDAAKSQPDASKPQRASDAKGVGKESMASRAESAEPFSTMVESAGGGSKKKWVVLGVAAAVVLAVAVAAVPLMNRSAKNDSAPAASVAPQPASPEQASPSTDAAAATDSSEAAPDATATADAAAEAARRAREEREREKRKREQDALKANDQPADASAAAATAPKPSTPAPTAPSGPKSVRVSVTYDEAGRVTQASVAGTTPGAEAYGSTAVRIARGKHFPSGKAGTTVVTIPVN